MCFVMLNDRAVPDLLWGNPAGAGFVKQIWPVPEPDFTYVFEV